MTSPTRYATTTAYGAFDADEVYRDDTHYAPGELIAGERVGPPLAGRRRRALRRGGLLLMLAIGGGWAALSDLADWRWLSAETASVFASLNRATPGPAKPLPPDAAPSPTRDSAPSSPQLPAAREIIAAPGALAGVAAPPPTATADAAAVQPLPPAVADPADPLQMRAAAVGLHPDLSRVLLERLSPADFRNAGTAIKTALAETADDAVHVWPRQRTPELALFQVSFVPGAATDCRRYVVKVTKDGWLTTALPMERCGAKPDRSRSK